MLQYSLIAPCGMNCGICVGHLYRKVKCAGCNSDSPNKPEYCTTCRIYTCTQRANSRFCFDCDKYPCRRLKDLDKRYRRKYGMSMIENLESIRLNGIRKFVANEKTRWMCSTCKSPLTVHSDDCIVCGSKREKKVYPVL